MSKRWNKKQLDFLRDNFDKMKYEEIGKIIGKTRYSVLKKTSRLGLIKGKLGTNNPNFKGGIVSKEGYILLLKPDYKGKKICKRYVYEHRFVVEQSLKRLLKSNEIVHHIDGTRNNNNIENLVIVSSNEHSHIHNVDKKKIEIDLGKLYESYIEHNISRKELAKIFKVSRSTIDRRLKDGEITKSKGSERRKGSN